MEESTAVRALTGACPTPVERAAMVQWWDDLTFLHWAYRPADVQRLLPSGLTVETFDGSAPRNGLRRAAASHEPWPLHHADLIDLDDSLVTAAGLGTPTGAPIVHWSPSVEVRIGWPQRAGSR